MHYREVKGILSARNGINLYRGCQHGCIYCDSRSKCYHIEHDFEDIEIKSNALELLEDALRRRLGISAGGGEAVLEVCMGSCPRSRLPQLHLGVGCAQRQRADLWWPKLPEAEESMLCALFLAEKIPIKEICVRFVEFRA